MTGDCRKYQTGRYTSDCSQTAAALPNWGEGTAKKYRLDACKQAGRVSEADVATKGPLMHKWAQGLKQWSLWLVGEGSTPDRSAGIMLAATVAVLVLLGGGAAWALQNPAPAKKGTGRCGGGGGVTRRRWTITEEEEGVGGRAPQATRRRRRRAADRQEVPRSAEYRKAVALALADGKSKKSKAKAGTQAQGQASRQEQGPRHCDFISVRFGG